MTASPDTSVHTGAVARPALPNRRIHAACVPNPLACGRGMPVAFDVDKREFFCIGCGQARACVCVRSPFSSAIRPVRVT